jgi:hypothetical protein
MGVGKKVVEHKTKKVVENVTEGIPVVGDAVDRNVKSGPLDRADDAADKGKDKVSDATDKLTGGSKKSKNPLRRG